MITSDSSYVFPRIIVKYIQFVALVPCLIHKCDRREQQKWNIMQWKLDNTMSTAISKETPGLSKGGVLVPNKKYLENSK